MAPRESPVLSAGVGSTRYSGDADIFVGRERELTALRAVVDDAVAGRGRLVLLAGEPGIGKTRTVQELAAHAEQRGMQVLWGRCHEGEGAPPYWPWVQILRAYALSCDPATLAVELGQGAADVAQIVPEIHDRIPKLASPATMDPTQARFRLFDGITICLKKVASRQPLVLVLDDLHWADAATLLLLQFLVREIEHASLMVVCTYRDEEVQPGRPLSQTLAELARAAVIQRLHLRGLDERDVARLIERVAGSRPSEAVARRISQQTDGNPLFVSEVVRWLVMAGGLESPAAEAIGLPPSVREVIGRRLERLSPPCREVLRTAAVVGRAFSLQVASRISHLPREQLVDVLGEAVEAGALFAAPDASSYSFTHALLRETLYAELPPARRIQTHREIGEALEAVHTGHLEPYLSELAHHFGMATSLRSGDKAIEYARRAGEHAVSALAYEDAVAHYLHGLRAFEASEGRDERKRAELLLELADARYRAGMMRDARATFEQTAALARQLAAPELLARTALRTGSGWIYVKELDVLRYHLLEEASRALPPEDSAVRALVLAWLARALYQRPETRAQRFVLSDEALRMARRVGDPTTLFFVLNCAYQAQWEPATIDTRAAIASEEARLAEQLGDSVCAVLAHLDQACSFLERGDIAAVDREIAIYSRHATELRDPSHTRYIASLRSMRALLDGEFHRVQDLAVEFYTAARESHDRDAEGSTAVLLMALSQEIGDSERWVSAVEARIQPETEQSASAAEPRCILALLYATTGRVEEARYEFDCLAAHDFGRVPQNWVWLHNLSQLAEVCVILGDAARAQVLYELMRPYEGSCVVHADGFLCRGAVARYLGLLATTMQHWEIAAQHFERAMEMHARMSARPWLAHTQHDYAAMLLAQGTPSDLSRALDLLASAVDTARRLGMTSLLEKAVTLKVNAERLCDDDSEAGERMASDPVSARVLLRHDGEYWTFAYNGTRGRLRDTKGLRYLAHLLRHPDQEFHVLDLVGGVSGNRRPDPGLPLLDTAAKADYRRRLKDLREQLAEAEQFNDVGRLERLRTEIEAVTEQLAAAVGLGGRNRAALSATERARSTVTQRIKTAIKRIADRSPTLADHLADRVKTGTFCIYRPDPTRPILWEL